MNVISLISALPAHRRLRRTSLAAGLLLGSVLAWPAASQTAPSTRLAQPGYYRMKVGDALVTALSDGTVPVDLHQLLAHATPAEMDQLLAQARVPNPVETSISGYLVELGPRLVLLDTGAGELYGPTAGHLLASLRAAGYQPAQITDVLLTHIHPDHVGGLMAGTTRTYPNATVHLSKAESDYWLSDVNQAKAPAAAKTYFGQARTKVKPYLTAGKLQPFTGNVEVLPGIRAVASPGHTPGHSFYALESKGQKLLFWGDAMHVAAVQFPKPEVTIDFDVDQPQAAATRKQAYADAAQQGYWVAVSHVSFPGIGHVRTNGNGYDWLPINYSTYGTGQ